MLKSRYSDDAILEAGVDEVGRGCLAGPVVAAAVILPHDFKHPHLNDSKQLNKKQRESLIHEIQSSAISYAVAEASHLEIDEINILNASFLAMHRALDKLKKSPDLLLIDGNRFKAYKKVKHHCIIEGDAKYLSIAAASVLAKCYRDDLMNRLHEEYPHYSWNTNVGYPTKQHREGIVKHGESPYHRQSFRLLPDQLTLPL